MRVPRHVKGRDGFTVIEVFIAMTILAITMVTSVGLMKAIIRGTQYSSKMTVATGVAEQKLEALIRSGYTSIGSGSDVTNSINRSWTSTTVGGVKQVTVTASWNDIGGFTKTVTLKSMVAP